jgi:hypothetical protein
LHDSVGNPEVPSMSGLAFNKTGFAKINDSLLRNPPFSGGLGRGVVEFVLHFQSTPHLTLSYPINRAIYNPIGRLMGRFNG